MKSKKTNKSISIDPSLYLRTKKVAEKNGKNFSEITCIFIEACLEAAEKDLRTMLDDHIKSA